MMDCRIALSAALLLLAGASQTADAQASASATGTTVQLTIDAHAPATPFPHFWEKTFGSGRAVLSLRDDYRKNLDAVHAATGFESVRFHGIFMDDVGLYDPERSTQNPGQAAVAANEASVYNFSYVDQIYDGLLEHGVRPFVELSFMPRKMASDPAALHAFWYKQNVSPPKDYAVWDAMIRAFAQHLVGRYGIEEVSAWKFEVWNEPNIDFWAGTPKQPTYFELYDHTARALKAVSPRLLVGGPSTAQAGWVAPFLAHAHAGKVPVDFVSTHVYANDNAKDVFGTNEDIPRDKMVWRSVKKVHDEIAASAFPRLPLIFSEYNASYANEPDVTDAAYMGPWLLNNIRLCDGLTESMAYWDFSDVFEEQGVVRTPFYGGFGLIAADRIPKAAFNIFAALHTLGTTRLALPSETAMVTRRGEGTIVVALWNYSPPDGTWSNYSPPPKEGRSSTHFSLRLQGLNAATGASVVRVDDDHGDPVKAFDRMGRPSTPTREQIVLLRAAGQASPAESVPVQGGKLEIDVPQHGIAIVELH